MIFEAIKHHVYLYLLFLTIVEGPITSFVSAGLAAQHILRIEYVVIIAFLGDLIGDVIFYVLGRFFGKIQFLKKFEYFSKQKSFLTKTLEKRPFFYLLIIKFTPYLAIPSLIFAGTKKMNFKLFLLYSFIISILVKFSFLFMGYLGSVSITQLQGFIQGRKQTVVYILIGITLFLITRKIYFAIGRRIRKEIKEELKENNP